METMEKRISPNGLLDIIIEKLIEERVFNLPHQRESESAEMEEKLISLSNDIRDKLGSDQSLLMRYEELSTTNENASLRDTYRKGFNDGVALLKEIYLKA